MDTFGFKLHISQMQICIMGIIMLTLHGFLAVFLFKGEFLNAKFLKLRKDANEENSTV